MPIDPRPYITLTLDFDTHHKIEALSEKAAWNVVRLLLWSARAGENGVIPEHRWAKVAAPLRREMLKHKVVVPDEDGAVVFRDFLKHQMSAAERSALSAKRSKSGAMGAHERHHASLGVVNPACEFCPKGGDDEPASPEDEEMASAMASAMANPSQGLWQTDSNVRSKNAPTSATRSTGQRVAVPAPAPDPHKLAADDAYETIGKAGKFMAIKGHAKWAMTERELTHAQFVDAYVNVYKSGRPVTRETLGQYIDGHKRQNGPTGKQSRNPYLEIVREMEQRNLPEIGA